MAAHNVPLAARLPVRSRRRESGAPALTGADWRLLVVLAPLSLLLAALFYRVTFLAPVSGRGGVVLALALSAALHLALLLRTIARQGPRSD